MKDSKISNPISTSKKSMDTAKPAGTGAMYQEIAKNGNLATGTSMTMGFNPEEKHRDMEVQRNAKGSAVI